MTASEKAREHHQEQTESLSGQARSKLQCLGMESCLLWSLREIDLEKLITSHKAADGMATLQFGSFLFTE